MTLQAYLVIIGGKPYEHEYVQLLKWPPRTEVGGEREAQMQKASVEA